MTTEEADEPLPRRLGRWVDNGLLTAEQAGQIEAYEATRGGAAEVAARDATATGAADTPAPPDPPGSRPPSLVVEALGYLGGVLVLVAGLLLGAQLWEEIPDAGRAVLLAGVAVLLLVGGGTVPVRLGDAGRRLRSVLWTLAVVAAGGTLGVLGSEVLDLDGDLVALLVFGGTAALAALLWWGERTSLLQTVLLGALVGTVVALVVLAEPREPTVLFVAVYVLGLAWATAGHLERVTPGRTARVLGAVTMLLAVQPVLDATWGLLLGLATVAALVAYAIRAGALTLLVAGAVGMLTVVPRAVEVWFPGRLSVPAVLLVLGALLVAAAVGTARRRAGRGGGIA